MIHSMVTSLCKSLGEIVGKKKREEGLHGPIMVSDGGEGGIRTPDTVARMPHFECGAFNRSATSPEPAKRSAKRCMQAKTPQPACHASRLSGLLTAMGGGSSNAQAPNKDKLERASWLRDLLVLPPSSAFPGNSRLRLGSARKRERVNKSSQSMIWKRKLLFLSSDLRHDSPCKRAIMLQSGARVVKRTLVFAGLSTAGIFAGLFVLWAISGFSSFGLNSDDLSFLVPGVLLTVLLTVALMAVMVHSNRSGSDEV